MLVPDTVKLTPDRPRSIARRCWRVRQRQRGEHPASNGTTSRSTSRTATDDRSWRGAVFNDLSSWERARHHQPRGPAQVRPQHLQRLPLVAGDQHRRSSMIFPRFPGQQSSLSPFLTGTTTFDPDHRTAPCSNDLRRRIVDMHQWACPGEPLPEPPQPPDAGSPDGGATDGARDAGRPIPPPRPTMPAPPPPSTMPPTATPPATTPGAAPPHPQRHRRGHRPGPRPESLAVTRDRPGSLIGLARSARTRLPQQ